jgi:hypothetical protein
MSLLFLDEVLDADCRVGSVDVRQHRAVAESGETNPVAVVTTRVPLCR